MNAGANPKSTSPGRRDIPSFAGLALDRPLIMGIVNATPDSFSDGGDCFNPAAAILRAGMLREAGADIIDIGGESTRPGASPVFLARELERVAPVVEGLKDLDCPISVDTRRAGVMKAVIERGAAIVNDISALTFDEGSLETVAGAGVSVVLMHMRGDPRTMNDDPHYEDVVAEVFEYLSGRIEACEAAGIARRRIAVDPGIGFAKTMRHNRALVDNLGVFKELGAAILIGVSRKFGRAPDPKDRLADSLAAARDAVKNGADILRVHDVAETAKMLGAGW